MADRGHGGGTVAQPLLRPVTSTQTRPAFAGYWLLYHEQADGGAPLVFIKLLMARKRAAIEKLAAGPVHWPQTPRPWWKGLPLTVRLDYAVITLYWIFSGRPDDAGRCAGGYFWNALLFRL